MSDSDWFLLFVAQIVLYLSVYWATGLYQKAGYKPALEVFLSAKIIFKRLD